MRRDCLFAMLFAVCAERQAGTRLDLATKTFSRVATGLVLNGTRQISFLGGRLRSVQHVLQQSGRNVKR